MDPTLPDTLGAALPVAADPSAYLPALSALLALAAGRLLKMRTAEGSVWRQVLPIAAQYLVALPAWLAPGLASGESPGQLLARVGAAILQGAATGGVWSQGRGLRKAATIAKGSG